MIKRRAVYPDPAFGGEQRANMGTRTPIERRVVAARRQDDVDLDPAHGCQRQYRNDAVVGQKVGRHDLHRKAGGANGLKIMNSIFSRSWSGPEVTARATLSPTTASAGNQRSPTRRSPVMKNQSSAKVRMICATTGPSKEKCVSRTGWAG